MEHTFEGLKTKVKNGVPFTWALCLAVVYALLLGCVQLNIEDYLTRIMFVMTITAFLVAFYIYVPQNYLIGPRMAVAMFLICLVVVFMVMIFASGPWFWTFLGLYAIAANLMMAELGTKSLDDEFDDPHL